MRPWVFRHQNWTTCGSQNKVHSVLFVVQQIPHSHCRLFKPNNLNTHPVLPLLCHLPTIPSIIATPQRVLTISKNDRITSFLRHPACVNQDSHIATTKYPYINTPTHVYLLTYLATYLPIHLLISTVLLHLTMHPPESHTWCSSIYPYPKRLSSSQATMLESPRR